MIEKFRVQNYKALRDVTLDLTPFHVLIGPNDSGKTSIMEALMAMCRSVDYPLAEAFVGDWKGSELMWGGPADPGAPGGVRLEVQVREPTLSFSYVWECAFSLAGRDAFLMREECEGIWTGGSWHVELFDGREKGVDQKTTRVYGLRYHGNRSEPPETTAVANTVSLSLTPRQYWRWDPRFLALPAAQRLDDLFRIHPTGFGLVQCLDGILGESRDRFNAIEARLREIFPEVESLQLKAKAGYDAPPVEGRRVPVLEPRPAKGIEFKLRHLTEPVPASQASDGMLIVLACLTILNLPRPPRLILIEEPENGIHPKRLAEVLKVLRELVARQDRPQPQILMTTHSPYVLDEFKPEEVTLCHKGKDGAVRVSRLLESEAVKKQLDVFSLGEIWTGEGDDSLARSHESGDRKP